MEIKAELNYFRMAPRKVRLVANFIKGMSIIEAEYQLKFLAKKSALPILKLLKSAVANAKNNFKLEESDLFVSKITVGAAPTLKRSMPRAMGRSARINKRSSHVKIFLAAKGK